MYRISRTNACHIDRYSVSVPTILRLQIDFPIVCPNRQCSNARYSHHITTVKETQIKAIPIGISSDSIQMSISTTGNNVMPSRTAAQMRIHTVSNDWDDAPRAREYVVLVCNS